MGRARSGVLVAGSVLLAGAAALLWNRFLASPPPLPLPAIAPGRVDVPAVVAEEVPADDPGEEAPRGIRVRVVDEDGASVAGARVFFACGFDERVPLEDQDIRLDPATAHLANSLLEEAHYQAPNLILSPEGATPPPVSGPDGSFLFECVDRDPVVLTAERDGFVPGSVLVRDPKEVVSLRLRKDQPIAGLVLDARTRRPMAGSLVTARLPADPEDHPYRSWAATDAKGEFTLRGLRGGTYDLVAAPDSSADGPGVIPRRAEGIAAGSTGVVLEIEPGLSLSGRVLEAGTGASPAGRFVAAIAPLDPDPLVQEWAGAAVEVDEGKFEFRGLLPGRYGVHVREAAEREEDRVFWGGGASAEAGASNVAVSIVRGKRITGRILLPADFDLEAVGGRITVRPHGSRDGNRREPESSPIGKDGGFTSGLLEPGVPHDVTAWVGDFGFVEVREVAPGTTDLVLRPGPPMTITGKVVDASGTGVGGALITVVASDGRTSTGGNSSGKDGSFLVRGIGAGSYRLYASAWRRDLAPVEPEAAVEAGASWVIVRVAPGAEFRARFVGADGEPVGTEGLEARVEETTAWQSRTYDVSLDREGGLRIKGLPRCRVRFKVSGAAFEGRVFGPFEVPGPEETITIAK